MSMPAYEHCHNEKFRTKSEYPYSYDPIRHFNARVRGKIESSYDDRMQTWDYAKWKRCVEALNQKYGFTAGVRPTAIRPRSCCVSTMTRLNYV